MKLIVHYQLTCVVLCIIIFDPFLKARFPSKFSLTIFSPCKPAVNLQQKNFDELWWNRTLSFLTDFDGVRPTQMSFRNDNKNK